MSLRIDAGAGLLLEHALEGRAHLVEVGLGLRLDRDLRGSARGTGAGRRTRASPSRRERVAGRGDGELGDGADLAGLELADGLLLLAVEQQQLADALVVVARRVPGVAWPCSVPDRTRR